MKSDTTFSIVMVFCMISLGGCSLFDDEDECHTEGTSCNGNILEACGCGETGISNKKVTCSLLKTDCSDYGAVCLYDGASRHGCYYTDVTCDENTTSMCIGSTIGDCDHNGSFCPNAAQDTDGTQDCDETEKVKFPEISNKDPCDNSQGEHCMETTGSPVSARCTIWPEHCVPETDTEPQCNSTIREDYIFFCNDGIWGSGNCGDMICCETSEGAECMESCEE